MTNQKAVAKMVEIRHEYTDKSYSLPPQNPPDFHSSLHPCVALYTNVSAIVRY